MFTHNTARLQSINLAHNALKTIHPHILGKEHFVFNNTSSSKLRVNVLDNNEFSCAVSICSLWEGGTGGKVQLIARCKYSSNDTKLLEECLATTTESVETTTFVTTENPRDVKPAYHFNNGSDGENEITTITTWLNEQQGTSSADSVVIAILVMIPLTCLCLVGFLVFRKVRGRSKQKAACNLNRVRKGIEIPDMNDPNAPPDGGRLGETGNQKHEKIEQLTGENEQTNITQERAVKTEHNIMIIVEEAQDE